MKHTLSIPSNLNDHQNNSAILESIPSIVYVNKKELQNEYVEELKSKKCKSLFKHVVISTVDDDQNGLKSKKRSIQKYFQARQRNQSIGIIDYEAVPVSQVKVKSYQGCHSRNISSYKSAYDDLSSLKPLSDRELSSIMSNESQNTKNGLATSSRNGDDVDSIKWNSFNTKQQQKTSTTLKKLSIKKLNSLLEKNQEFKKRINLPAIDSLKRCQTQTNSELLSNRLFNSSLVGSMLGSDGEMKSGNMLKAQSTRYQIFENEEEESSELLDNFLLDNQDNFSNNLIIGTSSIIGISQPEIKITEQESQDVFNKSTLVNQNSQQNQGFLAIPQKHAQLNTQSTSIKILPPLRKIHDRQKSSGRISQQQCQMNEQNIYNNDFISQNQTSLSQRENSNKYENQTTFKKMHERLYKLPKMNIIISQAEHTQSN